MRFKGMLVVAALMIACKGDDTNDTDQSKDTGDTGEEVEEWPSDYSQGQYRLSSFVLLSQEEGDDLDDDGEPDNKLPNALTLADAFISDDISPEGLNEQVALAIEEDDLVILLAALYAEGVLSTDVLAGVVDGDTGELSVDVEASYDEQNQPLSHLEGVFSDQTHFSTGPGSIQVPVTFYPDEPPLPVPLEQAVIYGSLEADASDGRIVGIIPADGLIDQVIDPLIPEEGYGDYTKEELMELISGIKDNEFVVDQELPNGERGVSAAFSYAAGPTEFEVP